MDELNLQLGINQKIEIVENQITYKSNIQDIKDDFILIGMPIAGSRYYMMHPGSIIEFYVSNEREVIKCRSVVIGRRKEKNLQLAMISIPEIIEKVQRREYFRLPISMEAKYYILPEESLSTSLGDVPVGYFKRLEKTITVDISGGGMKIITKSNVPQYRKVLVSISIPDEVILFCTTVRCEYNEAGRNYKLALRYEKIDERTRDKIIRFIFSKLREHSKLFR